MLAWHEIIAISKHTRSNDVGRGMPSQPLDGKHGRTTSGMTCHHRLWTAHTVERRRLCYAIIVFGQHKRSNDAGRCMTSPPLDNTMVGRRQAWHAITDLGQHTRSNDIGLGMPSSPLGSTDSQTASGVACHHRLWTANTVERRRAWHAIIAFMQHKRSNDVERGMPSFAFGYHKRSNDVGHGMTSPH